MATANLSLYASLFVAFQDTASFWLNELSSSRKNSLTKNTLRSPSNLKLVFRSYQYLVYHWNRICNIALLSQHVTTSLLLILSAFSTIRYFESKYFQLETFTSIFELKAALEYLVHPNGFLVLLIWLSITVPRAGNVFNSSQNVKKAYHDASLRTEERTTEDRTLFYSRSEMNEKALSAREIQMIGRSFPSLHVDIGYLFYYTSSTMLIVLLVASDHIVTLLITF